MTRGISTKQPAIEGYMHVRFIRTFARGVYLSERGPIDVA